jgi:hypothetical protein
MSRLLVAALALSASVVSAQPVRDDEIAEQIEKARRLVAVDAEGCVKYPQNEEIVVCGENPDNKSQRIFTDRGPPDENRIRLGEAVSQVRAACCSPIPKIPPFWTSSFGYVPPVAIPLEEVLKGLPEPDMIVTDGENAPP